MIEKIDKVHDAILRESTYSKSKSDQHGEVFTPFDQIKKMLREVPLADWVDPSKTYLDSCAGKGNFPIIIVKILFKALAKAIPDERERLKNIIEKQLFMCEYQDSSANFIAYHFQMEEGFKVNLYHGDSLKLPNDFFDLSWSERREKYPENCVLEPVEPENLPEIPVETASLPRSERVSKAKPSKTSAKTKKSPEIKGEKPDSQPTWMKFVQVDV